MVQDDRQAQGQEGGLRVRTGKGQNQEGEKKSNWGKAGAEKNTG
jgi:hypothetical protein